MVREYRRLNRLMGSAFEFVIAIAGNGADAEHLLDACEEEVRRIEALLTEFQEHSETSLVNRNAGIQPVGVSQEMYDLLLRCRNISRLTGGAFDITSSVFKKIYRFTNETAAFPSRNDISAVFEKTGYDKVQLLTSNRVFLPVAGMRIGFGGIGKGYAADRVKTLLKTRGVTSAVINASGDIAVWGQRADGSPWRIGISHPDFPERMLLWLPATNEMCIATSGNYEKFFECDGIRYGHTIDPATGLPVLGIKSVTVISPGAELSDALATAVTVKGRYAGIHFIDQLPNTHCIVADDENHIYTSGKLDFYEK